MRITSYAAIGSTAVAVGLYEGSMIGSLPMIFTYIHPVLPLLVIFFLLKRPQAAYMMAGISGVVVDLVSATPTGFAASRWLIVAFCVDLVAENVITNRSMYGAWILAFSARLLNLIVLFATYIIYQGVMDKTYILQNNKVYFYTLIADLILVSFLFLGTTVFTKRFLTFIPFVKGRYG